MVIAYIFIITDRSNDGYINSNELKETLSEKEFTKEDAKFLIEFADEDNDGKMSYEEWRKMAHWC